MFDYAIKNGWIVDGTGKKPYRAAVYVQGERIAEISEDETLEAKEVFDAAGLAVAPGFIDMHTHSDTAPYCSNGFESALTQGITFHCAGNCGGSLIPDTPEIHGKRGRSDSKSRYKNPITGDYAAHDFASYKDEVTGLGTAINFSTLIGHGRLRHCAMSDPKEPIPTAEEMRRMEEILEEQMKQGAPGMSLGLTYLPGACCKTEELIALGKVIAKYDGIIAVHMRSESEKVFEALDEMGRVARESGAHVHISHFKIMHASLWGRVPELLEKFDALRAEGLNFTADQYPYNASSTGLTAVIPMWLRSRKDTTSLEWMESDEKFARIRDEMQTLLDGRGGAEHVIVSNTRGAMPEYEGKTVAQIAREWGMEPIDAVREIFIRTKCSVSAIYYCMDMNDVLKIMARQDVAVASDGIGYNNLACDAAGRPHPRSVGTFVRFLRLNREHQLMPLEAAVRKMTSIPAAHLHLKDRGRLEKGCFADITVFDPETIADRATFDEISLPATGVACVLVNGVKAFENGKSTGSRSGKFLAAEK